MSLVAFLAPLLAGLLVGANPYTAHHLRARIAERASGRLVIVESAALAVLVAALVGFASWAFAPFISGRLTNGLLILGLWTLAGAVYAQRPLGRRRGPAPASPVGWRWLARYTSDSIYFLGPAWLTATVVAMRAVRAGEFALPYALAALGAALAMAAWVAWAPGRLPQAPPRPGETVRRETRLLGVAYGCAGVVVLAGYVGLV